MKKFSFLLLLLLTLFSCREEIDITDPPTGPEPEVIVRSSVYGVVTYGGFAANNVTVLLGDESTTTDQYGVFSFTDVSMFADGTYIRIPAADNYFEASRLFYPRVNTSNNVFIELLHKTDRGSVSSEQGGKIEFDGASIDLPAQGIVRADGSAYSGNVNVKAQWMDPTNENTFNQMPGDLVGINLESEAMALATFGMLAVELEDDNGGLLQIKEGHTAGIQVPVPQELQNVAPSEIPLWHFETETGYWIEEGSATLVNGVYEGEVSHFSFWNCDAPFPLVEINGFVKLNNIGIEGLLIKITDESAGVTRTAFTGQRGYYAGKVPKDRTLTIEIHDECGAVIHTEHIGPFSSDTSVPAFNITPLSNPVSIAGTLSNCNGNAVNAGYILLIHGNGATKTYPVDDNGNFDFTILNCNATEAIVIGFDETNNTVSEPFVLTFATNLTDVQIEACDSATVPNANIDYVGSPFDSSLSDLIQATWNAQIFTNDKTIYNITVVNWDQGFTYEFVVISWAGEITTDYTIDFGYAGFSCSGTADLYKTINPLTGGEMVVFKGTSTDINITDASIYDPAITEVVFDLAM